MMNKLLLSAMALLFSALHIQAQTISNAYDDGKPLGWGASVTGSNDENPITVTNYTEFVNACKVTTNKTIYVKGEISFSGSYSLNTSNKTIYGLPGSALVNTNRTDKSKTGILTIKGNNIILRNLTFKSAGAYDIDGNDNITVDGATNVWIDHCDIQDGVDGNLDVVNGADKVCISWTRFRYLIEPLANGSGGSDDHRNCNLIGNSDKNANKDTDKLRVTFKNCWWDEGCHERCPRVRFGKVHIANCLFSSSVVSYCIGYGYKSNIYAEGNAFTSAKAKKTPWKNYATSGSYTDYNITTKDNLGVNEEIQAKSGSEDYWIPSTDYSMSVYDASLVESVVGNEENGAGATLTINEGEAYTTGIETIAVETSLTNEDHAIYNQAGQRVNSNYRGLVIKNGKKYIQK